MANNWDNFVKGIICVAVFLFASPGKAAAADRVDPFEQVKQMQRGVNIIGYDPMWKNFEKARFKEKHFKLIREGGFQTVRINLHAFSHMDSRGQLKPNWLKTLDWAVKGALENNLNVILDLHNFTDIAKDPAAYKTRFLAFWKQIAPRFKDASPNLMFEILNEPNTALTPALWNTYLREALTIIRETNPARNVVIGPAFWNGIDHLSELELPKEDHQIIVTIHYYHPMAFTHQGAPWAKEYVDHTGVKWGTDEEKQKVVEDFGKVNEWATAQQRPILLGEFGAYDKAEMELRAKYTAHLARTAESLGWAWTYWQFDSDFIVYDIDADHWIEPIWKALIP
jgi:endoglucanase